MDSAKIAQLKAFIQLCDSNPSVLQDPSLRFFRNYLEKLDAKLPPSAYGKSGTSKADQGEESDEDMPELEEQSRNFKFSSDSSDADEESEVELDNSDIVDPDNDSPQQMGDATIEVTEEMRDNAQIAKGKAMDAIAEGDLDTAASCLTEAILANPSSAILYANRAGVYVKMKKPNAAVRDADAAIKINPDSAKGYKWRGKANAMLGHWEDAAKDLHLASSLDYDEEIAFVLKKVEPNVHKIEEHRRKYQRLRREHELKKAARNKAKKEHQCQHEHEHQHQHQHGHQCQHGHQHQHETKKPEAASGQGASGMPGGGFPGGFPGAMPGGIDISKILSDPELLAAFQDPEVMAALQDVMKNPANLAKHQGNPKVAPFIAKMMSKVTG